MKFPAHVKIVEVGPRDGLQNESRPVPTATKIEFIDLLSQTGLSVIEATAFVSPQWVPQMADHAQVMRGIHRAHGVSYPVLIPNLKGLEAALACEVKDAAVFVSASEAFSLKNINCSIAESFGRLAPVAALAKLRGVRLRGYVSCALGCPYQGTVSPPAVADVAWQLVQLGCEEISLGDTIGVGTPDTTRAMLTAVLERIPADRLAGHFHDTSGNALLNIYTALELGLSTFDSSVTGLGGCPFAPGASGNVATEEVIHLLQSQGIETGVDPEKLLAAGEFIRAALGKPAQPHLGEIHPARPN